MRLSGPWQTPQKNQPQNQPRQTPQKSSHQFPGNIAEALSGGSGLTPSQLHTPELEEQVVSDMKKLSDEQFSILVWGSQTTPRISIILWGYRFGAWGRGWWWWEVGVGWTWTLSWCCWFAGVGKSKAKHVACFGADSTLVCLHHHHCLLWPRCEYCRGTSCSSSQTCRSTCTFA